ncbi:MAG: hypothetical protein JNM26_16320 [Ideonella sp.]|nr:hypothetical protein [Ideonella sp.]
MTTSTRPLSGPLLAALVLAGAASAPTPSHADGRHVGPGFHGARVVTPVPAWRVGGPRGGYYRGGGHWHGHRHGHGWGWGGLALGLGLGALIVTRPWDPVVVERPTYVYVDPPPAPPPRVGQPVPPASMAQRPADPVIYPSRGQTPEQTEADRQDCNRWATTQPAAMADASVFHRATLACLEGRGYTVR